MVVVGVLTAAMGGAGIAQAPAPGLGPWKLNDARSKYSPGPAPKSASVTFSAAGRGGSRYRGVVPMAQDGLGVHREL